MKSLTIEFTRDDLSPKHFTVKEYPTVKDGFLVFKQDDGNNFLCLNQIFSYKVSPIKKEDQK